MNQCTNLYKTHGFYIVASFQSISTYLYSVECWEISEEQPNFTILCSLKLLKQQKSKGYMGKKWDGRIKNLCLESYISKWLEWSHENCIYLL